MPIRTSIGIENRMVQLTDVWNSETGVADALYSSLSNWTVGKVETGISTQEFQILPQYRRRNQITALVLTPSLLHLLQPMLSHSLAMLIAIHHEHFQQYTLESAGRTKPWLDYKISFARILQSQKAKRKRIGRKE